jgi:hypothetical protein
MKGDVVNWERGFKELGWVLSTLTFFCGVLIFVIGAIASLYCSELMPLLFGFLIFCVFIGIAGGLWIVFYLCRFIAHSFIVNLENKKPKDK